MLKIEKLTPTQEKELINYRDKWLAVGLSTDRIDRKKAIENFTVFNNLVLGNKTQPVFVFMDSPLTTWLATLLLYNFVYNKDGSQVESQVESQVRSQVRSQVESFVYPFLGGNFDSSYFSFYNFCNKVLKINFQQQEEWDCYLRTSDVGLIYSFKDFVVISEKPASIKMKDMVLHNDSGAAVLYADGFSVYALNGVRVSKELVETSAEQLDPHILFKETNAEIRREIVRKIGIERVCQKLGAKTLEKRWGYELLNIHLGDERIRPYLKMVNPSIGTFHLEGIHPDCKTVEQALNWRNGWKEEIYEAPINLT